MVTVRSILIMHVFVQFLTKRDLLDQFMTRLLIHCEFDETDRVRNPGSYEEGLFINRSNAMHTRPRRFVGKISWAEAFHNDGTNNSTWSQIDHDWQRLVERNDNMFDEMISEHARSVRLKQQTYEPDLDLDPFE